MRLVSYSDHKAEHRFTVGPSASRSFCIDRSSTVNVSPTPSGGVSGLKFEMWTAFGAGVWQAASALSFADQNAADPYEGWSKASRGPNHLEFRGCGMAIASSHSSKYAVGRRGR
jgi:hypothetical protein